MNSAFDRIVVFSYGTLCYLLFLGAFFYVPGFMANVLVPKSIDSGVPGPVGTALLINVLLLSAFAVQHSGMARPVFKDWLTKFVPKPAERSTYVLLSSLLLYVLFWQWRPIPAVVWEVRHPVGSSVLLGFCFLGWAIVFYATLLIDHFDLFGMRQVTLYLQGRPYTPRPFMTPSLYKYPRTPSGTLSHLQILPYFPAITTVFRTRSRTDHVIFQSLLHDSTVGQVDRQ